MPDSTTRDCCDICGSASDVFHWAMGRLWCEECFAGQRPAVAKPCTPRERQLLLAWIQPLNRGGRP